MIEKERLTKEEKQLARKDLLLFYFLIFLILGAILYVDNLLIIICLLIVLSFFIFWIIRVEFDVVKGYKYIFEGVIVKKDIMKSEKGGRKEFEIEVKNKENISKIFEIEDSIYFSLPINSNVRVFYLEKSKIVVNVEIILAT